MRCCGLFENALFLINAAQCVFFANKKKAGTFVRTVRLPWIVCSGVILLIDNLAAVRGPVESADIDGKVLFRAVVSVLKERLPAGW